MAQMEKGDKEALKSCHAVAICLRTLCLPLLISPLLCLTAQARFGSIGP
jgi:hypothetical protein